MQRNNGKRYPSVLVTGFGPFPGVPVNLTAQLVTRLGATPKRAPPYLLHTAVLPVDWSATVKQLDALYGAHSPDIALHFGVSHRARGFEIETVARNCNGGMVDAAGHVPINELLDADAPQKLRTRLPVADMVAALRASGLPARRSRDAGTYLCNATLFHALRCQAQTHGPSVASFVHLPTEMRGGLTWPGLMLGARVLIDYLVNAHHSVTRSCPSRAVTSSRPQRR